MRKIISFFCFLLLTKSMYADEWQLRPGNARDIGIGANGATWIIGNTPGLGGFSLHRWNGSGWETVEGGGVRIAVDPKGNPWVVKDAGTIIRREGNRWIEIPGALATDIGIGPDGVVWITSKTASSAGFSIQTFNPASPSGWRTIDGGAERIAVSPNGLPWVVDRNNVIHERLANGTWKRYPGQARDIAIGANGATWVIGNIPRSGSYSVHFWNSSEWVEVDGGGTQVAVNASGAPWISNHLFEIFQRVYTNNRLSESPTLAPVRMTYSMGGRISSLFANPSNANHVIAVGETGGIFECINFLSSSRSWIHQTKLRCHQVMDVLLVPSGTGTDLWAVSMNTFENFTKPQIWKRVAGGEWQQANFSGTSAALGSPAESDAYRIIKSKRNNDLYAIGAFGVAYKPEARDEWSIVSTRRGFVSIETMSNGNIIAAGSTGLQVSTDNGRTWNPVNISMTTGVALPFWNDIQSQRYCIKSDPAGSIILAGRRANAIGQIQLFGSTDLGQTWQPFRTPCGLISSRSGTGGFETVLPFFNSVTNQLEMYISNTENIHYGYAPGSNAVTALTAAMVNTSFPWLPGAGFAGGVGFNAGHEDTRQVALIPSGSARKIIITSDGGLHLADFSNTAIHSLPWITEGTGTGLNALQLFNHTGNDREWVFGSMDNGWGYSNSNDYRSWSIGGGREGYVINRRGAWTHNYTDHTIMGISPLGRFSGADFTRISDQCPASPGSNIFNSPSTGFGTPVWYGNHVYIHDAAPVTGTTGFPWKISKDNGCTWQNLPSSQYIRKGGAEATFLSVSRQPTIIGQNSFQSTWLTVSMQHTNGNIILGRLENPTGAGTEPIRSWQYPPMTGLDGGIAEIGQQFLFHSLFCVNPSDPQQIFAVEKRTGRLKVSSTGGNYWTDAASFNSLYETGGSRFISNNGTYAIWSMAISPFDPRVVLVGTVAKGVFLSMNGGVDWQQLPTQGIFMPTSFFWRSAQEVLVATYGRGLYKIRF